MDTYNIVYRYHSLYGGDTIIRTNAKRVKADTYEKAIVKSGIDPNAIREVWVRVQ